MKYRFKLQFNFKNIRPQIPSEKLSEYLKLFAFPVITAVFVFPFSAPLKNVVIPLFSVIFVLLVLFPDIVKSASRQLIRNAILIVSVCLIFSAMFLGHLFYYNFSNYDFGDIACYLSSFYKLIYSFPGTNIVWGKPLLAMHSEFTSIPVAWIFQLFPHPTTLLILQCIPVLAAWLLFRKWIYNTVEDSLSAELLALSVALSPWILSPLLRGYHGISTGLPLFVLASVALLQKKWRLFLFAVPLLLLVKEICVLTVFWIGVLAFLQKYEKKWYVYPIVLSILYGIFLKYFYFPLLLGEQSYYFSYMIGKFDVKVFIKTFATYLVTVYLMSGNISVFKTKVSLMVIPAAGLNSFLGNQFVSPQFHYIVEPVFWGTVASVFGFSKNGESVVWSRLRAVSSVVTMVFLSTFLVRGLPVYSEHVYQKSYTTGLKQILPGESVSVGAPLVGYLWKADRLSWVIYDDIKKDIDKIILQKNNSPVWCLPSEFERVKQFENDVRHDSAYSVIWEDDIIVVFGRGARSDSLQ